MTIIPRNVSIGNEKPVAISKKEGVTTTETKVNQIADVNGKQHGIEPTGRQIDPSGNSSLKLGRLKGIETTDGASLRLIVGA